MRQALHKEQQDEALERVGRRVPRVGVGDEIERLSESWMKSSSLITLLAQSKKVTNILVMHPIF